MPLVVPALRLAYVFINVFETFKTLRLPPPSARNGGQPSARAMSQRKRAMKGCMTVWLVWSCYIMYERWVEAFVWLFVPFYSELKSLVILFFLLTRAKGAEPIYLHVLRPLIKPYSGPLDALFDALASFGDLMVLVASIPVNYVLGFYRRWTSALDPPQADPQTWHRDEHRAEIRPSAHRAYASEASGDARPAAPRDMSTGSVKQTRSTFVRSDSSTPTPKIWHPPASAYAEDIALNPHSGLPTPPIERQQRLEAAASPSGSEDWRQYPAFPSAYPPTPLPASSRLFSGEASIVAPRPVRAGGGTQFSGVDEDDEENPETRQDFRKSLLLPREPRNPGSDGDLSDENHMQGVQQTQTSQPRSQTLETHDTRPTAAIDSETEMSVDGEGQAPESDDFGSDMDDDEDEDMFNTTLRTPSKRRRGRYEEDDEDYLDDLMLTPPRMRAAFSIDSQVSRSTALSTTDDGSSLRTRTNSVASTDPFSLPDGPSPGKKRRLPSRYADDDVKFSVDVPASKAAATGEPTVSGDTSRSSTVGRRRGKALQDAAENTVADETDENVPVADYKLKRTTGTRVARPKPQRGDSQGTIRAPSARTKNTRPAVTRPPSARVVAARKEFTARKERASALPVKKPSTSTLSVASGRKVAGAAAKGKTQ